MRMRSLLVVCGYLSLAMLFFVVLVPLAFVSIWGRFFIDVAASVSPQPVAIVLGAAAWHGYPSPVFADRLRTAAELYQAGKVESILVSGHHVAGDYSEVLTAKAYLAGELGLPQEVIVLDYAGYRTYDTCARAALVFGVDAAILVTQSFHLPRAVFTCQAFGIEARGVAADKRSYQAIGWYVLREQAARIVAFWEATLFRHPPTVLESATPIPSAAAIR